MLTDLCNAIMQLIFIVTGLVSIKSLTEMITQLIGQGDALKDGADTAKEVKKLAGQAAGATLHGAAIAKAGVTSAVGVGKTLAGSPAGQKLKQKAGDAKAAVSGKIENHIANSDGAISTGIRNQRQKRSERLAADNKFVNTKQGANRLEQEAQKAEQEASYKDAIGDTAGAAAARNRAALYRRGAQQAGQSLDDMRQNGVTVTDPSTGATRQVDISRRGKARGVAADVESGTIKAKNFYAHASKMSGFEDGIGIKAAIKGDASKDTAINKVLYGGANNKKDETNIYNQIKNTNKFVFNVTNMKGEVKDFLDNADVLETIEDGNTAMTRQLKEVLSHTGAKSDRAKATQSAESQAKATASAMNETLSSITAQLASIQAELKKKK